LLVAISELHAAYSGLACFAGAEKWFVGGEGGH